MLPNLFHEHPIFFPAANGTEESTQNNFLNSLPVGSKTNRRVFIRRPRERARKNPWPDGESDQGDGDCHESDSRR